MSESHSSEFQPSVLNPLQLLRDLLPDAPQALRDPNHPFWEEYDQLNHGLVPRRQSRSGIV
jgi:hypothetical protein